MAALPVAEVLVAGVLVAVLREVVQQVVVPPAVVQRVVAAPMEARRAAQAVPVVALPAVTNPHLQVAAVAVLAAVVQAALAVVLAVAQVVLAVAAQVQVDRPEPKAVIRGLVLVEKTIAGNFLAGQAPAKQDKAAGKLVTTKSQEALVVALVMVKVLVVTVMKPVLVAARQLVVTAP